MGKTQFQTRLDPDDTERVEQYRDDHDLSNSEAVRRLVRTGLDAAETDGDEATDTDDGVTFAQRTGTVERAAGSGVALAVVGIAAATVLAAPLVSKVATAGAIGVATYSATVALVARLRGGQDG